MKKKFIALTPYAREHLTQGDQLDLLEMIGCEVFESDEMAEDDNSYLLIMPDGEKTHRKFLVLEELDSLKKEFTFEDLNKVRLWCSGDFKPEILLLDELAEYLKTQHDKENN